MDIEQLNLALIKDKAFQCEDNYMITFTGFLDSSMQEICRKEVKTRRGIYFGGYEDAERKIAIFVPEYVDAQDEESLKAYFIENEDDCPLAILRVKAEKALVNSGRGSLKHGDYLGAILGLGIKRESIGDILVGRDSADIVILKSLAGFLEKNYDKVGRREMDAEVLPISALQVPELVTEEVGKTVASLRLDSVMAAAFGRSRSKMLEVIRQGRVYLNNIQCLKPEKTIKEGDKLVLRGRGKVVLKEVGGSTRKDRIFITLTVYK